MLLTPALPSVKILKICLLLSRFVFRIDYQKPNQIFTFYA